MSVSSGDLEGDEEAPVIEQTSEKSRTSGSRMSIKDLKDERVPECLFWDCDQVADFIENLGFPQYKEGFLTNRVNGRKLIHIHASALPPLGVTDFQHIKKISGAVREILKIEAPDWHRRIAERPRDDMALFLELKACTGERGDDLTYKSFERKFENAVFQPPLSNHCAIFPHDQPSLSIHCDIIPHND